MSTRGTIAMVVDGGAVDTIFCRYDSYLEWVGGVLALYEEQEDIAEMMDLGDMFSLGPTLSECQFYHRDIGGIGNSREETRKVTFASLTACVEDLDGDIKWLYLFADDQWWVRARGGAGFYRLKDALAAVVSAQPTKPEYWICLVGEFDEVMAAYGVRPRLFTGRAPLEGARRIAEQGAG